MKHRGAPPERNRDAPGISLHLLLGAARSLEERIESALSVLGLSFPKYGVLDALATSREPLTLSELANRLSCVRSNITQLIDRLESDGLVRRIDDAADRRIVRAALTDRGAASHATAARALQQVEADLQQRISEKDRSALIRGLTAMR